MKCFKCGTLIDNDTEVCPNCGQNLRKIKKEFSPNMYNKIKSMSSDKSAKEIPMDISIGDSISEQYIIHEYLNDDLIFYSFIGIDSFNKQKIQIDFVKPSLLKTEHDKSQFINSLREEKFRQHENLAIIYDYGKHNDHYYIVSEYIEGITLKEIIDSKQENFTLEEIEPIIAQISDALTEIHEDSLIGYLIPENIIIMKDILKIRNTFWFRCFNHKNVLKYFSSETPSYYYLAPELRGGSPKLINATDLYSVGVIMSALLVSKIYKGVPFNLTEYNKDLPLEIDALFLKLVHKNANKRFQNVEDFLIEFDKLFTYSAVDHEQTTRVVNTADILSIEEESFDFEDEMETSMLDKNAAQAVINKFEDDERETTVIPKNKEVVFEDDEKETKIISKKQIKKEDKAKKEILTVKKEDNDIEEKTNSDTSFNAYKNPFYEPEEIRKEQELYKQQKEFQEYQKSVYQQLSDFQERDNRKNLIMVIGFFTFALIIVVLILIMFLKQPGNGVSKRDAELLATIKKQQELINNMNKKLEELEKRKEESRKEVLLAEKERKNKENELLKQEEKIKEIEKKKEENTSLEEKKKLEEEKKKAEAEKERLRKELEAKKKAEEEKRKKEEELRKKLQKEKELLARKKAEAEKKKAQKAKMLKNKELARKLEEAKRKEALRKAKEEQRKKAEAEKKKVELAKKKAEAKRKSEKNKKDLDAEAEALLASAMEETKKEQTKVVKDGKCPKGMIKIKAGPFKFGSPASDPTRGPADPLLKTVTLNTYCIDRFESKGPVSFNQAQARCKKRGKRLCTTQEWEKACKGKYNRVYPYGNKFNPGKCNTADADGNPRSYKPTGTFKRCRSPYGLYDMSGNLAEWTKYGNSSRQVLKGGSYKSEDYDAKCSSTKKASKGSRKSTYGYRCCKDL